MLNISTKLFRKLTFLLAITLLLAFSLSDLLRSHSRDAAYIKGLPAPNKILKNSYLEEEFNLRGFQINADNPYKIDFIFEKPKAIADKELESLRQRIISYFFAALTVSSEKLWVNLSPYEQNRVIDTELAETSLGIDMLAQDYVLKQLSASLTAPGTKLGKEYWEQLRSNDLKSDVGKVWISSDSAEYYIGQNTVMLGKTKLKLEADNNESVILPKLEEQVNQGKHFSNLRQIYNAVLLSHVFKEQLKIAKKSNYLFDPSIKGIENFQSFNKDELYELYLKAYQQGVYDQNLKTMSNYKSKNVNYFSGGVQISSGLINYKVYPIVDYLANRDSTYESVTVELKRSVSSALQGRRKDVVRDDWADFTTGVDILRADLEVCIAVAAYNENTKERRLVHVFPASAYARAKESNDLVELTPTNRLSQAANYAYYDSQRIAIEKVKVLNEMLGFLNETGWKIAVVGSNDSHNQSVADKFIGLSDVVNFSKNRLNVKAENMVVDDRDTYKVVQYSKDGDLHINYLSRLSDYKQQDPDRVINFLKDEEQVKEVKPAIDWGLKHDGWIEGVKLKRLGKARGDKEIKLSWRDFGNSSDLRFAEYMGRKMVARKVKKSRMQQLEKINLSPDLSQYNAFDAIKILQAHIQETGVNYLIENPRYALKLKNGSPLILSEEYSDAISLKSFLKDVKLSNNKLNPYESISIVAELYKALSWLHSSGVAHNDIGLSNIVFNSEGNLRLADLGEFEVKSPIDHFAYASDLNFAKNIVKAIDAATDNVYTYSEEHDPWDHYKNVALSGHDHRTGYTIDDNGLEFSKYMVDLAEKKLEANSSSSLKRVIKRLFMSKERAWKDKWLEQSEDEASFHFKLVDSKLAPSIYSHEVHADNGSSLKMYFDSKHAAVKVFVDKDDSFADIVMEFEYVEKQVKKKVHRDSRNDHKYRETEQATTNIRLSSANQVVSFGDTIIDNIFEISFDKQESTISIAMTKRMHHMMVSNRFLAELRERDDVELIEESHDDYVVLVLAPDLNKTAKAKDLGGVDMSLADLKLNKLLREFASVEDLESFQAANVHAFELVSLEKNLDIEKKLLKH